MRFTRSISARLLAAPLLAASVVAGCAVADTPAAAPKAAGDETTKKQEVPPVLNFTMKSLDGKDVDLSKYQGKVILMVNTASKCGYTKQYTGLEKLHETYGEKGLVVLGFPCNDFGGQEPGTELQIGEFCQKNYGVKFDMFAKIQVKGEGKAPLYKYLTSAETNPKSPGEVGWNFEKFLIAKDGSIAGRYKSGVAPESAELTGAIEAELAK